MERELIFGLTGGETFVVAFIALAIVSAPWWPRLGARLAAGPSKGTDKRAGRSR